MSASDAGTVIAGLFVAALVLDEAWGWLRRRFGSRHSWNSLGWCIHCGEYWPNGMQEPIGCRERRR